MHQRAERSDRFSVVGIGAAACAACCVGPLVALLGGFGLAGLASTLVIGAAGLVIAAAAAAAFVVVRRRTSQRIDVLTTAPLDARTGRTAGSHGRPLVRRLIPLYDVTAPIACTISADEIPGRIDLLERIRANLAELERTEHGMLLRFPNRPDVEADLRKLAIDEKRCCQFWGFEVAAARDVLTLRWDGPPASGGLIDRLAAFFAGDEPAAGLAGLL